MKLFLLTILVAFVSAAPQAIKTDLANAMSPEEHAMWMRRADEILGTKKTSGLRKLSKGGAETTTRRGGCGRIISKNEGAMIEVINGEAISFMTMVTMIASFALTIFVLAMEKPWSCTKANALEKRRLSPLRSPTKTSTTKTTKFVSSALPWKTLLLSPAVVWLILPLMNLVRWLRLTSILLKAPLTAFSFAALGTKRSGRCID